MYYVSFIVKNAKKCYSYYEEVYYGKDRYRLYV